MIDKQDLLGTTPRRATPPQSDSQPDKLFYQLSPSQPPSLSLVSIQLPQPPRIAMPPTTVSMESLQSISDSNYTTHRLSALQARTPVASKRDQMRHNEGESQQRQWRQSQAKIYSNSAQIMSKQSVIQSQEMISNIAISQISDNTTHFKKKPFKYDVQEQAIRSPQKLYSMQLNGRISQVNQEQYHNEQRMQLGGRVDDINILNCELEYVMCAVKQYVQVKKFLSMPWSRGRQKLRDILGTQLQKRGKR